MKPVLLAKLTRAYDGGPLAVVDGLPGDGAELRPHQLRALAAALVRLADATAAHKTVTKGGRTLPDARVVIDARF